MRLSSNNIRFVKEVKHNGKTKCFYVAMISHCVSDLRRYEPEGLPATVRRFIGKRRPELFHHSEDELLTLDIYIYRR